MNSVLESIKILVALMSLRRRWQLLLLIGATLLGAMAEFFSIAAVIPFLTLLADPQRVQSFPLIPHMLTWMGWSKNEEIMLLAVALFASAVCLAALYRVFLLSVGLRFTFGMGKEMGVALYQRVLYQPYSYHVNTNSSAILASLQKVDAVVFGVINPLIQGAVAAFFSIAILGALIWVDYRIALSALGGFVLIYTAIGRITGPVLERSGKEMNLAVGKKIQATQEGLGGIRDVLIDGTQVTFVERFKAYEAIQRQAQRKHTVYAFSPRYLVEMAGMILIAGLALFLAKQQGGLHSALPILGMLAMGAQKLLPQIQQLYGCWASMLGTYPVLVEVSGHLTEPPPLVQQQLHCSDGERMEGEITIHQLGFRYSDEGPWVLRHVDLTLPKGIRAGFVGKTGGGKTTLVDLVMGLLQPVEGGLKVGGRDVDLQTMRAWQNRISHVPQFIFLADASIWENIAFGVPASMVDMQRVRQAAKQAQMDQFIDGLEQGYDTRVGERGVRLSGGQRQRIGLARALYKDISLLILDEATSALDDETEAAVMDAVYALGKDITVLMIAHRTSTLQRCDVVYEVGVDGVRVKGVDRE